MACMADNYASMKKLYPLENLVVSAESMFSYKSNSNYNRFSGGLYSTTYRDRYLRGDY